MLKRDHEIHSSHDLRGRSRDAFVATSFSSQLMATTRRGMSTRQFPRTKKMAVSTDQLAEQLASGLTISNTKGKQKAPPVVSDEDVRLSAMRSVNSASQALSAAIQSGWKYSPGTAQSKPSSSVNSATASAAKHLAVLRTMRPDDLDVERAATSVLTKLVSLEMVRFIVVLF
jgi:separase